MVRELPGTLREHLGSGATTLCWCWKFIRRDAVRIGFTDHDRDVTFDGVVFSAASGLHTSAAEADLGLAAGGGEVQGVLESGSLQENDIRAGLYDGAAVEIWRVNWQDVQQRILMDAAEIGEISRNGKSFVAELRSLAHAFDQESGRLYQPQCSANLGDAQCSVNLEQPIYSVNTPVLDSSHSAHVVVALPQFEEGWFTGGRLTFVSGANAGFTSAISAHSRDGGMDMMTLQTAPEHDTLPGDEIRLRAGCSKTFAVCRSKFSNSINFRGFPHIPGNDVLLAHAGNIKQVMDGGSLYR